MTNDGFQIFQLINVYLFTTLVSDHNKDSAHHKIRVVFGFDSQFFNFDHRSRNVNEKFFIFGGIFTFVDAVSSALLIWASITVQRWLMVSWLFCAVFNIICHVVSLSILSFRRLPSSNDWITALTVFHTIALFYFTLIVAIAHYFWRNHPVDTQDDLVDQELSKT